MNVIVWEFTVPEQHREAFEKVYGPDGDWAVLFRTALGYCGSELLRDTAMPGRYLTIDRWETPEAFAAFKQMSGAPYDALDHECEDLIVREVKIGTFEVPSSGQRG